MIESNHTQAPVKSLTTLLLKNFDKRYSPPKNAEGTKVSFSRFPEIGEPNRYCSVHPYFFVAAFLDLPTKKALKKKMMMISEYENLHAFVLELMVEKAAKKLGNDRVDDGDSNAEKANIQQSQMDFAFEGLYDNNDDDATGNTTLSNENNNRTAADKTIKIRCEHQLASYDLIQQMKMKDKDGKYNDPLKFWKEKASQFPELSQLASEFLSIPATSAPSERIWSRAARVITAKHARLSSKVTSRMIFVQENVKLMCEHWDELMPNVPFTESYFPEAFEDIDEEGNKIDVGQDDDDDFGCWVEVRVDDGSRKRYLLFVFSI